MKPKAKTEQVEIEIIEMKKGTTPFCILGTTPIILHRLSEKAKYELLYPAKKTRVKTTLKHDPMQEFLDAPYILPDPKAPTYLAALAASFKQAVRCAALDIPGASKTEIGRLCWVNGERLPIYGIPKMIMSPVRQTDMKRTPDIRTRAIIERWVVKIDISYVMPQLNPTAIAHLVGAAGMTQGVGDWRQEKGSGTYGGFQFVDPNSPEVKHIIATGGRAAQQRAMQSPDFYDRETEELYRWFVKEVETRGETKRLNSRLKVAA